MRVGVLLPCRNEARVIERRLSNLARLDWPECEGDHRLLVVDDHSTDGTASLARGAIEAGFAPGVRAEVTSNETRPGKNGAIEEGLGFIGGEVDLIVLTDADVLVERGALRALVEAFSADARLGMVCGSQRFVASLDPGGSAEGSCMDDCSGVWDRWTARVRGLESRFGRLFSVHGQWLAWRAELGLVPRRGVAADDIDLMMQVRGGPCPRVRLVPGARFFECKPAPGAAAEAQGLRRARAWFQAIDVGARPQGLDTVGRLQWWLYAHLPALSPAICLLLALILVVVIGQSFGVPFAAATLVLMTLVSLTPFGREWRRTFGLILRARRLERTEAMPESWEMRRDP